MIRTFLYESDVGGSVMGWRARYSISRSDRTKVWTVYVHYTDPECPDMHIHHPVTPADFLELFDEEGIDAEEFCSALQGDGSEELEDLAERIGALAARDTRS